MKKRIYFIFLVIFMSGLPGQAQDIFDAVSDGDQERVKALLLEDKSLVNLKDQRLNTPLHFASEAGNTEIAQLLINNGANVNAQDDLGRTPLHRCSAFRPNLEMIGLLIQNGVDTNILDGDGNPAVSSAIDGIHVDAVKKIIEGGFSINKRLTHQSTILHQAAEGGNVDLISYLIEQGADVNVSNVYGVTPLHVTAVYGHKEAAELLFAAGADISAKSKWCGTPMHQAIAAGYKELGAFLKKQGAKVIPRNYPELKGKYLGIKPPDSDPQLFAPEVLQSIFRWAKPPIFSPDGQEMYWSGSAPHGNGSKIWIMHQDNGKWTYPKAASFSSEFKDQLACLSPDGHCIFFNSRQPLEEVGELKDADLWLVEKKGDRWGNPMNLGPPINTSGHEMRASISESGILYLDSDQYEESFGGHDIYLARPLDSSYSKPENLGPAVNSRYSETSPVIAPDESYLIFGSDKPGGFGLIDRYISFRQADGSWGRPRNLGKKMNSSFKVWLNLSLDGKYFFFVSNWQVYWMETEKLIKELKELPYSDVLSGMAQIIGKDSFEDALDWYREAKKKYADFYPVSEIPLNTLGYQLLGQDKINAAIEVFKLATIDFPESWNAYDSYAEALMRDNQTDAAIKNYEKSLELNPDNNNAREMLKKLK